MAAQGLNSNSYLVVIAGGKGTRFWPKSTSERPKQLLSFAPGQKSLLAETLDRFDSLIPLHQRLIVTTEGLKAKTLEEGLQAEILAEPQGRNTAPCIYWAAKHLAKKDPKAVMVIMPADHSIAKPDALLNTLRLACDHAQKFEDLVTVAIQPTAPETGYGYLRVESGSSKQGIQKVETFVEKPNLEKAKEYLKSGNYFWNAGMFVWRAEVILKAFDQIMPEMKKAWDDADGRVDLAYPKMTATSIDYGILEKANNVVTVAADCGWDDLGSWTSLESLADSLKIRKGKNVVSAGQLLAIDSEGNVIDAPEKYVALLGIKDLIVVQTKSTLMISQKSRAQDLKLIVEETKKIRPDLV